MQTPDSPSPDLVPVDRFPKTVAWPQVTFLAAVMAVTLLPLIVALMLAA